MQKYNKFLTALIAAIVTGCSAFGLIVPEQYITLATTAVPAIASVLVYAIPNSD